MFSKTVVFAVTIIAFSCCLIENSQALPDTNSGIDSEQLCLINCAQCEKMYGDYFQGPKCADSCMQLKGKAIPDCQDTVSIGPFLSTKSGVDFKQACLTNCVQCKKMYGGYFQGRKCAESCVQYKVEAIPDCQDFGSIAPFLNSSKLGAKQDIVLILKR